MKAKQKFCGNCGNHNVYEYPEKIFCSKRFSKNEDPIVETLSCCPEWNPSSQECYCVEEALNKQNKK
ncbi:MAG: hypothetical protein ACUVTB_04185 [Candidatus Bathycorpusculaceae bacterium]